MVKVVLFDVDDTLSDWPTAIDQALDATLPLVEGHEPTWVRARFWEAVDELYLVYRDGLIIDRIHWQALVDPERPWQVALPDASPDLWKTLAERFRSSFRAVAFADARPALDELKHGYDLAVLSNNPYAERVLGRLELASYFSRILSTEEEFSKPHPEAFSRACSTLGLAPGEIAYVGDSIENDVEGALPAGMTAIWLDRWGYSYELPPGVHRITTLTELPELLVTLTD